MSKIALTPNATGTGVFTISSPATNTDRTLTLPDITGTLVSTDASGNVGIGVTPSAWTSGYSVIEGVNGQSISFAGNTPSFTSNGYVTGAGWVYKTSNYASNYYQYAGQHIWRNAPSGTAGTAISFTQAMTLDSSGNLLVGTTSNNIYGGTTTGINLNPDGATSFNRASGQAAMFNRISTDGDIVQFRKNGTEVGSISVSAGGGQFEFKSAGGTAGVLWNNGSDALYFLDTNFRPSTSKDNVYDIGRGDARFDDIYATNGTIQTSDRNEKQDIEALSDAEQRVAVACKGLLRKFRWKDAVAEKGDDARIHFGIIAQDLQDAFAAEGLDAGRYAMFISSTWWETDRVVPAVEATDDTEAVAEHTVTDHYDTLEEAPEGATERTRLGVRYPELLAFIIGAL